MRCTSPIIPSFHPDPSVCRVGDAYYLVNSSFEYVAGVPIFHSRDLVHWYRIGYCLTWPAPLTAECSFARHLRPDDRYHNGTFYMIATNVDLLYGSGWAEGQLLTHSISSPFSVCFSRRFCI